MNHSVSVARKTFTRAASLAVLTLWLACNAGFAADKDAVAGDESFRIVTPEWLAAHLSDPDVRVLDVRSNVQDYFLKHISNAVHLADTSLRAPLNGLPVQYLGPDAMAGLFERAGVSKDGTVVLYSQGDGVLGATTIAYSLHRIGYKKVALLDGGIEGFKGEQKLTQVYPDYKTTELKPQLDRGLFVTFDQVKAMMKDPNVTFVDARPPKAYRGDVTTWMRNGHIPGAINIDWHQLMNPDNLHQFKPVDEMRRIVESSGIKPDSDFVVYCGTSREASLLFAVMKHVLQYPKVRLYEGSWTEYCAHDDMPVAKGDKPLGKEGPKTVEADPPADK